MDKIINIIEEENMGFCHMIENYIFYCDELNEIKI